MICVDIPHTPSLKVARSRLDLYDDAEDENDADDVIPAASKRGRRGNVLCKFEFIPLRVGKLLSWAQVPRRDKGKTHLSA